MQIAEADTIFLHREAELWVDLVDAIDYVSEGVTPRQLKKLDFGFRKAAEVHRGKFRATGEPYIEHPIEVTLILIEQAGITSSNILMAALMHDVIEDRYLNDEESFDDSCERPAAALVPAVGEMVFDWLVNLSKPLINGREVPDEEERVQLYLDGLDGGPIEVLLIKMADRLHNDRTQHGRSIAKQKEQLAEAARFITLFERQYRGDSVYRDAYDRLLGLLREESLINELILKEEET